jgi:hypothetical protein
MHSADELRKELSVTAVKQITTLAKRQLALEEQIKAKEAELESLNKAHYKLTTDTIPEAMSEAEVKELVLENGMVIKVEPWIAANIKEDDRPRAHAWLRDHGFGSLIKRTVSVVFGMGEDKKADQLVKELARRNLPFDNKEAVNANTLRAFVKEQLASETGAKLPKEIGVTTIATSIIKRKK